MKTLIWTIGAGLVGIVCTGMNALAVADHFYRLEGNTWNYLSLAAPFLVGVAALIPPVAIWQGRLKTPQGNFNCLLLWLLMLPICWQLVSVTAERIHTAKAGEKARIDAKANVASRAKADLATKETAALDAKKEADKYRSKKDNECFAKCKLARSTEARTVNELKEARQELELAETKSVLGAANWWTAPDWLLGLIKDGLGFVAIGIALHSLLPEANGEKPAKKRKARRKPAPRPRVQNPPKLSVVR